MAGVTTADLSLADVGNERSLPEMQRAARESSHADSVKVGLRVTGTGEQAVCTLVWSFMYARLFSLSFFMMLYTALGMQESGSLSAVCLFHLVVPPSPKAWYACHFHSVLNTTYRMYACTRSLWPMPLEQLGISSATNAL